MNEYCRVIAVEGGDGVGKYTHSSMLLEYLKNNGKLACRVQVPVKSNFTYPLIYKMLENGYAKKYPNFFQAAQFVNKVSFQLNQLHKLIDTHEYVILDRWSLSCYVYGIASGANAQMVSWMSDMLLRPHLTIVLVPQHGSMRGVLRDTYESDSDMQETVNLMYGKNFLKNNSYDPRDVCYVQTSKTLSKMHTHTNIITQLKNRFGEL